MTRAFVMLENLQLIVDGLPGKSDDSKQEVRDEDEDSSEGADTDGADTENDGMDTKGGGTETKEDDAEAKGTGSDDS